MRPRAWLLTALVLLAVRPGAGQPLSQQDFTPKTERTPAEDRWFKAELSEKVLVGNQDYRYSDTDLFVGLPEGFNLTADFTDFKTDITSATPAFTFGAGKDWRQASLSVSYGRQMLANDFESNTFDARGSLHSDSDDFRTTASADVAIIHNSQFIRQRKLTQREDITQRVPTLTVKQQFYDTRLTASLTQYGYNKDVGVLAQQVNRTSRVATNVNLSGLEGLVQGFPDYAVKFGAYQDVGPATFWATYQNIKLIDTSLAAGQTTDSYTGGVDCDIGRWATVTGQYNYLRETGLPVSDIYGLNLTVRF